MKPEAVERLMRAAGYMDDVEGFADALGVEDTTVRRWLSGEVQSISRTSRKLLRDLKARPGFEIRLNDFWREVDASPGRADSTSIAPTAPMEQAGTGCPGGASQPDPEEQARRVADVVHARLGKPPTPEEVADKTADKVKPAFGEVKNSLNSLATQLKQGLDELAARLKQSLEEVAARLQPKAPEQPTADEMAAKLARRLAPWVLGSMAVGFGGVALLNCAQRASNVCVANGGVLGPAEYLGTFSSNTAKVGEKVPAEHYIPNEPLEGQKRAPCDPGLGEATFNGGCWYSSGDVKPPCGRLYRSGNKCYRPVAADPQKNPFSDEP